MNTYMTLEQAREWYNSGKAAYKKIALQNFSKEELAPNFRNIKTFDDACQILGIYYSEEDLEVIEQLISRASVAMFKLNIIRKALHIGQDLYLAKDTDSYSGIWYPYNPIIPSSSTIYAKEIKSNKVEVLGKIKSREIIYNVLNVDASTSGFTGLGSFNSHNGTGLCIADVAFLGCASREIAEHFGKYFGMLITKAKYGDMVDFEIIEYN